MLAVKHQWLEENNVRKYLHQLCINNLTVAFFLDSCHRHVDKNNARDNPEDYCHNKVAATLIYVFKSPGDNTLPEAAKT
jgi:hypothetical protein